MAYMSMANGPEASPPAASVPTPQLTVFGLMVKLETWLATEESVYMPTPVPMTRLRVPLAGAGAPPVADVRRGRQEQDERSRSDADTPASEDASSSNTPPCSGSGAANRSNAPVFLFRRHAASSLQGMAPTTARRPRTRPRLGPAVPGPRGPDPAADPGAAPGRPPDGAELIDQLGCSRSRVSNHLACLRWCGFVEADRWGRTAIYSIRDQRVAGMLAAAREMATDHCHHLAVCTRIGPDWV